MTRARVRRTPRVRAWRVLAVIGGLGAAMLLDGTAYRVLKIEDLHADGLYQVLRQLGYFPSWLIAGVLIWLMDTRAGGVSSRRPGKTGHHRAGLVVLSAGFAGLAAEVLKLVFRRLRPGETGDTYAFRAPWEGLLDSSGLGLPSGHTAVAFGGCVMVALLWPRVRWVMLVLAAGCGVTRLLAGAHFLSDVVCGGLLASWVAVALWRAGEGPRRGPAGGVAPV